MCCGGDSQKFVAVLFVKGMKDVWDVLVSRKLCGLTMVFWPQKSANHKTKVTSFLSYLESFLLFCPLKLALKILPVDWRPGSLCLSCSLQQERWCSCMKQIGPWLFWFLPSSSECLMCCYSCIALSFLVQSDKPCSYIKQASMFGSPCRKYI